MSEQRLHPLHTPAVLMSWMSTTGCYPDTTRGTGRTTILALQAIAVAMQNPHKWVHPSDHHGTVHATRELHRIIREIVNRLEMKHFTFRENSLCFGSPT